MKIFKYLMLIALFGFIQTTSLYSYSSDDAKNDVKKHVYKNIDLKQVARSIDKQIQENAIEGEHLITLTYDNEWLKIQEFVLEYTKHNGFKTEVSSYDNRYFNGGKIYYVIISW